MDKITDSLQTITSHYSDLSFMAWNSSFFWVLLPIIILCIIFSIQSLKEAKKLKEYPLMLVAAILPFLLIIFFLLKPEIKIEKGIEKQSEVAVVIDASPSMTKKSSKRNTFFNMSLTYLLNKKEELYKISKKYNLKYYLVQGNDSSNIDSINGTKTVKLGNFDGYTDIEKEISYLKKTKKVKSIILLSDGNTNDVYKSRYLSGFSPVENDDKSKPKIFCLDISNSIWDSDIKIDEILADDFAYAKNLTLVSAKISLKNSDGKLRNIPITLKRGPNVLASKIVSFKKDTTILVEFEYTPESIGRKLYSISIPVYKWDSNPLNNRKHFASNIIRDRIRVLIMVGKPSWDQRFLRRALKKDPSIDLMGFNILRSTTDIIDVPNYELSLIPLPYKDLLTKELNGFDLLIFQNFSYRTFFSNRYMEYVEKYVKEGGAFLMVGGDLSFAEGGYKGTAIEKLLPFEIKSGRRKINRNKTIVKLSNKGKTHPITNHLNSQNGRKILSEISINGINNVGAIKNNSQVLLKSNSGKPVFAVSNYKKGRVAAIATDEFWKYNFKAVAKNYGNSNYLELIRKTVRWLIKDQTLSGLNFPNIKDSYISGKPIVIDVDYDGNQGYGKLVVKVINAKGKLVKKFKAKKISSGRYNYELPFLPPSIYAIKTIFYKNGVEAISNSDYIIVDESIEFVDKGINREFLKAISNSSGGEFLKKNSDINIIVKDLPISWFETFTKISKIYLWRNIYSIIFIILAFCFDWYLRKSRGLL